MTYTVLVSHKKHAIDARVEKIGRLAEEHDRCIKTGDALGLLQLAEHIEETCKHMSKTARTYRLEAAEMEKHETQTDRVAGVGDSDPSGSGNDRVTTNRIVDSVTA